MTETHSNSISFASFGMKTERTDETATRISIFTVEQECSTPAECKSWLGIYLVLAIEKKYKLSKTSSNCLCSIRETYPETLLNE